MIILPLYICPSPGTSKLNIPASKGSRIKVKLPPHYSTRCRLNCFKKKKPARSVRTGSSLNYRSRLLQRVRNKVGVDHVIHQAYYAARCAERVT